MFIHMILKFNDKYIYIYIYIYQTIIYNFIRRGWTKNVDFVLFSTEKGEK
jgi:hypothetical protein